MSRALALLDLPADVQQRVESGSLPRTAAYELTKLAGDATKRDVAEQAAGSLTLKQTAAAVRQRKGKKARRPEGIRQTFQAENGIKVTVTAKRKGTYHEIEEALEQALEEVRLRINNNIQIF